MSDKHHGNPVATYIITALVLGIITYIEFALVEYEVAWLTRGWIFFWLITLSIAKFIIVVAIFMHLKDDEKTYTGFFGSGMLIALATFLILPLLFTVRALPGETIVGAHVEPHEASEAESGLGESERIRIETHGYNRPQREILDIPPPLNRSLVIEPPAARDPRTTLRAASAPQPADAEGEQAQEAQTLDTEAEDAEAQDGPAQEARAQDEQPEEEQAAGDQGEKAQAEFDRELGETVYSSNCQACHQATGSGVPGVFPPLAGNLPGLYSAEGGREYLIDVLLHGLSGPIEVNGESYNGNMPPWDSLSDEQIAAVLNHELTAWDDGQALTDFTAIAASDVEARRGEDPGDLNERRAQLLAQ